jgi:hypothetical protein
MTTEMKTIAAETTTIGIEPPKTGIIRAQAITSSTLIADFAKISHLLSQKVLRRPRAAPLTAEEIRRSAQQNPPPPEWYEGEDERPF